MLHCSSQANENKNMVSCTFLYQLIIIHVESAKFSKFCRELFLTIPFTETPMQKLIYAVHVNSPRRKNIVSLLYCMSVLHQLFYFYNSIQIQACDAHLVLSASVSSHLLFLICSGQLFWHHIVRLETSAYSTFSSNQYLLLFGETHSLIEDPWRLIILIH